MTIRSQNSMQPTFVNLALASRGLAPTRVASTPVFTAEHEQPPSKVLPVAGIVVRAVAIAALLLAAVASLGGERPAHADAPVIVAEA